MPVREAGKRLLQFENVHHRFGERAVLHGLSVTVPLSGVTFVVGRSGAGKSVLCRLAVGLLKPTSGKVELLGERVDRLSERQLLALRGRTPYLVQSPALLDWLSLEDNVWLADRRRPRSEVQSALERVGVAHWAARLPGTVGPGIQKRAAIARALLLRPDFLLLDEPTTGLDPAAASRVMDVLRRLQQEGLGALVVSHDYRALREVADRVLLVADGTVQFVGSTEAFLSSREPAVEALRGSTSSENARDG